MKNNIIASAIAALALLTVSPQADARPHRGHHSNQVYVSGYRSCGTPIYTERYVPRRNPHCGSPAYRQRVIYAPVRYAPPPRRCYVPPQPVCPPSYPHHYRSSGVVFHGSFRL